MPSHPARWALCVAIVVLAAPRMVQVQSPPPASQQPAALPGWMEEFLPHTPDERARAAFFDHLGSAVLRLGTYAGGIGCGAFIGSTAPYYEFVASVACSSEFVVFGTARPVSARLNNRGTYVYTQHAFDVRRWLRAEGETRHEVEVLAEGGVLLVGGQLTGISGEQRLEPGKDYLLFLKRVPRTSAFALAGLPLFDRPYWFHALRHNLPLEIQDVPFDRFVDDLAIAAARCRPAARRP